MPGILILKFFWFEISANEKSLRLKTKVKIKKEKPI